MLLKTIQVLTRPREFGSRIPLERGIAHIIVLAFVGSLALSAANHMLSVESAFRAPSPSRELAAAIAIALAAILSLVFPFIVARVFGVPSTHAWSIAIATLGVSTFFVPFHLASRAALPESTSQLAETALFISQLIWQSALLYFGAQVSQPNRALAASLAYIGLCTALLAVP